MSTQGRKARCLETTLRSYIFGPDSADAATGVNVMTELYDQMREDPYPAEVDSLWRDLGLQLIDGNLVLDDEAPLSDVRRSLTAPQI